MIQCKPATPEFLQQEMFALNINLRMQQNFQARIVIQNALFAIGPIGRKKASRLLIPRATYTSPEIAHVGLYPQEAAEQSIEIDTFIQSFEHVDRAILESAEEGFVKVHTRKGTDQIVGATIVAEPCRRLDFRNFSRYHQ